MLKTINLEIWDSITDIKIYCDKFEQQSENEIIANEVRICFDGVIRGIQHG